MNNYRSTELNELFASLSKAQAEIKVAAKDSSNPFFKSKYANLQAIVEASRPALCKNGLAVSQQIISEDIPSSAEYSGGIQDYLVTMLCHSSGQWLSSKMRINPVKSDIQSLGSYITYLRRYSYAAIVGVYDGDDDDGNSASTLSSNGATEDKVITHDQAQFLAKLVADHSAVLPQIIKKHFRGTNIIMMKQSELEAILAEFNRK